MKTTANFVCPADGPDWLEQRKRFVTASEIGTVMGLNNYQTPIELWAEKVGKKEPDPENDWMRYGKHMEPFIAELYQRREATVVVRSSALFAHPNYEHAACTPDGWDESRQCGLEFKATTANHELWKSGEAPIHNKLQAVYQCGVMGWDRVVLVALVGGNPNNFYTVPIDYDPEVFATLMEKVDEFMGCVKSDTPPEAQAGDALLLSKLNKHDSTLEVSFGNGLAEEAEFLLTQYRGALFEYKKHAAMVKQWEKDKKLFEAKLYQLMGGAGVATFADGSTLKALMVSMPERTLKPTEYLRFSLKEAK